MNSKWNSINREAITIWNNRVYELYELNGLYCIVVDKDRILSKTWKNKDKAIKYFNTYYNRYA